MKIIDYIILGKNKPHELTAQICDMISQGWQPWGSLFIEKNIYIQAMVLYKQEEK